MRRVPVSTFGPPEVLESRREPDPEPGPGEVAVAVAACDVLWLETMIRAGHAPEGMAPQLPYVPGNGVAGRVAELGAGVDRSWENAEVVAHTGNQGGYADRVVLATSALSPIPPGVQAATAAAVLHDGPTALRLFDVTQVTNGDAVLVVGASGGLGQLSVQLARSRARPGRRGRPRCGQARAGPRAAA